MGEFKQWFQEFKMDYEKWEKALPPKEVGKKFKSERSVSNQIKNLEKGKPEPKSKNEDCEKLEANAGRFSGTRGIMDMKKREKRERKMARKVEKERNKRLAVCPTGKVIYLNPESAQRALDKSLDRNWKVKHHYRCPLCSNWHLTSQEPRRFG